MTGFRHDRLSAWPRIALLGCVALATRAGAAPAVGNVIGEHALAQQGFAIALASNVLQSHLLYVLAALGDYGFDGQCTALDDTDVHSGGIAVSAASVVQGFTPTFHADIYYDGACETPYMSADVVLSEDVGADATTYTVSNLATHYVGIDGATPLATLTTNASLTLTNDNALSLHGLGAFAGAPGSGATASLGLVCGAPTGASTVDCAGGIVQTFASLGVALGSVSPLTLSASTIDNGVDFASTTPAAFSSGTPGSLLLGYGDSTDSTLSIGGGSTYGSDEVSGHVAVFSLLPPPPTDWSADDTGHDLRFSISVVDPTTRSLDVSITRISDGAQQASGHLDQSGTGSITFSDGSTASVVGWIIADAAGDSIFVDGFDPRADGTGY